MTRKIIASLLCVLTVCTALAGCQSTDGSASREITLCNTYAINEFHPVLTPDHATDNSYMYFAGNFYNTLIRYENGGYEPELAEDWSVSEDGLVYTFKLKSGVKFSDGAELNAEAVKTCFESIPVRLGQYNGSYGRVSALFDKIVAVDELTVEIHLTMPYYGALKDFTMAVPMAIVSPNAYNSDGTVKADTKTKTFGTGAYMYEGDNDGTTYNFVANPYYWGEKPEVEAFSIMVIPDNDAKILALRNGEIDAIIGADKISLDAYGEMEKTDGFDAVRSDATEKTRLLALNASVAPFDDPAVRIAVNHAIDKAAICDGLFDGLEVKADNLFDRSYPFCDVDVPVYGFDAEKAKTVLESAGWIDSDGDGIREKDGVKLSGVGVYMAGTAMYEELAQTVSAQLRAVGIDMDIQGMDMMTYYQSLMENTWNLSVVATYGMVFDPFTTMANMDPRSPMDPASNKFLAHVEDAAGMMDTLNAQTSDEGVAESYRAILTAVAEGGACVPLSYAKELMLYNSEKIAGYAFPDYPTLALVQNIDLK